jgi:hypothetical protein
MTPGLRFCASLRLNYAPGVPGCPLTGITHEIELRGNGNPSQDTGGHLPPVCSSAHVTSMICASSVLAPRQEEKFSLGYPKVVGFIIFNYRRDKWCEMDIII